MLKPQIEQTFEMKMDGITELLEALVIEAITAALKKMVEQKKTQKADSTPLCLKDNCPFLCDFKF